MARRYHLSFKLFKDEEAARVFCDRINRDYTPYARKHHRADYTPHTIRDNYGPGMDWVGFVAWYSYPVG